MSFLFLLLYITLIYIRPGEWIPMFYGWQLMDITAIAAIIFFMLELAYTKKNLVRTPQNYLMLGFLGALVASHASHFYFAGAVDAFVDFFKKIVLFFLVVNVVNTEKKFKTAIALLIIWTMVMAIQGIYQYNTGIGLAGQTLSNDGRIRWIGIFNDANDLALTFVIIIPFLMNFVFRGGLLKKALFLPMLVTLLYAIYLTNSRGGILALMTVALLYFGFIYRRAFAKLIGFGIGTGLAALIFIFGPSRMGLLSAYEDSAFNRVEAWYEGFQMLKSSPLFGVGMKMFMEDYSRVAHNSFIHCAAETGLVGLFFWMALIYFSFKNLLAIQRINSSSTETKSLKQYANALAVGLFGFLAAAFFLSRTYITLPYLLVALSTALFNIAQQKTANMENAFGLRDIRNVGFLSIAMLVFILVIIKTVL